jgi:hypothetical protein
MNGGQRRVMVSDFLTLGSFPEEVHGPIEL